MSFDPPVPPTESNEALREALLSLRRDYDALRQAGADVQQLLEALESLLGVEGEEDPFVRVFSSLRKVFTFSQALMLAEPEGGGEALECIVAEDAGLLHSRWPVAALFRKVMGGKVVATFSTAGLPEWEVAAGLGLSPAGSALLVPVRVRERRGILLLLRDPGLPGFDRGNVGLARRYSVLVSHALATRYAAESAAESRRLLELSRQLRQSEQVAKRNADLLQELVRAMPVGVAVQDEAGRLLVVNDAGAQLLGARVEDLLGELPPHLRAEGEQAQEAQLHLARYRERLAGGLPYTRERSVTLAGEARTVLLTGTPVRIFDEYLMLSTSLDITERKRFEEEMQRHAFHDPLTGLPNRALMNEIVDKAVRAHQERGMFALAFIDIDNFKQVNDYYSHGMGDQLLIAFSRRVAESLRPSDTLARISGDEFLLLVDPAQNEAEVARVIERVLEACRRPFVVECHELLTSASVGVSFYPAHGGDYETLRRCADSAIYQAKSLRKGSVAYFDASMGHALTARMDLEQSLRAAVRDRHFRNAYQPKVRLADETVVGFEALVRWVEPDGRIQPPGVFIEMAGELGLLDDITLQVLDDIARELPCLSRHYGAGISVSFNVSAQQAGDMQFIDRLLAAISASGIARRLVVELTEDALVAAQQFQDAVLPRLRALGVRVSIDDFGTGYSSLSTLADITADELKVDRAFITGIHERARSQGILKAIESVCRALQISMVAEGVEEVEELEYLRSHTGIATVQGYCFGRPAFLEDLLPRSGA